MQLSLKGNKKLSLRDGLVNNAAILMCVLLLSLIHI